MTPKTKNKMNKDNIDIRSEIEPTLELAGRVIDELKSNNELLLVALKNVIHAAQKLPLYFTDKKYRQLYTAIEKAKEAIKANETI